MAQQQHSKTYTAPNAAGSAIVMATSVADSDKKGQHTISIKDEMVGFIDDYLAEATAPCAIRQQAGLWVFDQGSTNSLSAPNGKGTGDDKYSFYKLVSSANLSNPIGLTPSIELAQTGVICVIKTPDSWKNKSLESPCTMDGTLTVAAMDSQNGNVGLYLEVKGGGSAPSWNGRSSFTYEHIENITHTFVAKNGKSYPVTLQIRLKWTANSGYNGQVCRAHVIGPLVQSS